MSSSKGETWIWLSGGSLALVLLLLITLCGLVMYQGLGFFWPKEIVDLELRDGTKLRGQITDTEIVLSHDESGKVLGSIARIQLKRANRDFYGSDYIWVDESSIVTRKITPNSVVLERREWGDFIGELVSLKKSGEVVALGSEETALMLSKVFPETVEILEEVESISKDEIGALSHEQTELGFELDALVDKNSQTDLAEKAQIEATLEQLNQQYLALERKLDGVRAKLIYTLVVKDVLGTEKEIPLANIVHSYHPNALGIFGKSTHYLMKLWEFLSADPREANTEGGVFPAIFGTVMMVILMSIIVTPLGVITAIYLREYATQGKFVSLVRIAVNNLAGVPSIVFGVFGVGFFIYTVGAGIDQQFFSERLPSPTFGTGGILWASLTLALLTLPTVIVAAEEGLAAIPQHLRDASYALGATKFETLIKVVLPSLTPSILTGVILAVARAAGEVAPLMITGVVKLAPSLPIDSYFPFFHFERKFMHLGFHIYDVGFQSPNVDAARPMVFTTTLLLLFIVVLLNITAIYLRNKLQRRYSVSGV